VTSAELLEVSFVSVPSNRDAAVLMVKDYDRHTKAGARNSRGDADRLQSIHDFAVENGAKCAESTGETSTAPEAPDPEEGSGKSPASNVVEASRLMAAAYLASLD
jgi:hypothetical protein